MKRVVITGMGVISPVGNNVETFWNNLINGVCGIDRITYFPTDDLPVKIAGEIRGFNAKDFGVDPQTIRKSDRFCLYALAAANQAMEDSGLKEFDPARLGVYVGSGIGGMDTFIAETRKMDREGANRISPLFIPMMISTIRRWDSPETKSTFGKTVCAPTAAKAPMNGGISTPTIPTVPSL